MQCLDIARAIQRSPQTLEAYFAEVSAVKGESAALDAHVAALRDDLRDLGDFESRARDLCDRLAVGLQAAALFRAGVSGRRGLLPLTHRDAAAHIIMAR